ncbi:unnamed protein product [Lymnaea stagnalis]|uniref:Uncharacterized protein n=1 Tax=Lymnaea stagnalis TaxID=6523 RepID=A0AAV2IP12_LYMST
MQSDRIWGNMFKLDQDTQAPQIGDCKLDLTLCNLNNHVGDHSALKSSKRQDWFDIDNISLSESFSSLTRDDIYTVGDMLSCSSVLNNNKTNQKSMDGSDEFHDYFTRKSRHSHLEDISLWEGNVKGEINGNTDRAKPDTKKSSGDDNQVWMKVTNAKKQKVSISDRLEEFRQQEKYKNLTTRILEIYKNLTREEAQDILETVFTETHGMIGMRQPQILSEVQAALTELYPEKIIVLKKVNLNISAKYSTANSSKNINKSAQSKDSTLRSSGNVSKHTSAIDNNSSVSDSDSSDDLLQTSEWNIKKQ